MPVKWYGAKFTRDLRAEQNRRLDMAAQVVVGEAKRNLSTSGTGIMKGGVIVRAVKRTKKTIYGAFPSAPGQYPHKQTGALKMHVQYESGTNLERPSRKIGPGFITPYGKYLELGTWKMAARPWLVRSFNNMIGRVRAILAAPWKWHG